MLICIRFTCPRCYSEGQEDRLAGGQRQSTVREHKLKTFLSPSPSSRDTQVKLTWQCRAFLGPRANDIGHFLNIASCDFGSSVWLGGEGRCSISQCAQVTSHTHTTVYDTLSIDERPDLRRLSFCLTPQRLKQQCVTPSTRSALKSALCEALTSLPLLLQL